MYNIAFTATVIVCLYLNDMSASRPLTTEESEQPFNGTLCPLTLIDLNELWLLDLRVFIDAEAYERDTFRHLLTNPTCVARQIRDEHGKMSAFAIAVIEADGVGHVTTIGVSPEHRRRGLARGANPALVMGWSNELRPDPDCRSGLRAADRGRGQTTLQSRLQRR